MPATTNRGIASLAAAVIAALLVGGCSSQTSTPPAAPDPSTGVPAPAATAASSAAGPLTGAELVWLDAISALHKKIDTVLTDSPSNLTSATLQSLADRLHDCSRDLVRLGSPTPRLQLVHDLADQGCGKYEEAARCFDTAAGIGIPVMGTAGERQFDQAIDCGFTTPGEGSELFAAAEIKGFEIKQAAAR